MATIHQLIPNFAPRDAIGNHTVQVQAALRAAGHRSEIYAEVVLREIKGQAKPYRSYERDADADLLLYHASTGSEMAAWLHQRPEPLALDYHNITPAELFDRWEPAAADSMRRARAELASLATRASFSLADSTFNREELDRLGYRRTAVASIIVDLAEMEGPADPGRLARTRRLSERGAQWLFVGRLAPNKCQHDVIGALAAYRRLFEPDARLVLVGGATAELYRRSLLSLCEELGVADAVEITGSLPDAEVRALYAASDVFVCLSEHEGFLVPAVEAMHAGLPVVAFGAGAVPETVGDAGLVLDAKDPVTVAVAVDRLRRDEQARTTLVEAGRKRAEHFDAPTAGPRFVAEVERGLA